jgi:cardiolipin synthase
MRLKLLVDSGEFWGVLREDIRSAQQSIYIQTFSFEGDTAGKSLADALLASKAVDKRIIVDDYTRWMISDKYLYSPRRLFDAELRQEVRETYRMIDDLRRNGIKVQFTHPVGLLGKLAMHNHKKVVVIDGHVAYIGGINFSEHNFEWHDSMLRIADPAIAEALATDFQATWTGEKSEVSHTSDGMELHTLGGFSNHELFGRILAMIEEAKEQIYVESPYITFPFLDSLGKAVQRGCSVTLVTPRHNNYPLIKEYLLWVSAHSKINVRLYHRMTHLKAMLIDRHYLILGSSNYDYLSYQFHQEIVAIFTNLDLISEYVERVFHADIQASDPGYRISNFKGSLINLGMRLSAKMISSLVYPRSCSRPAVINTP